MPSLSRSILACCRMGEGPSCAENWSKRNRRKEDSHECTQPDPVEPRRSAPNAARIRRRFCQRRPPTAVIAKPRRRSYWDQAPRSASTTAHQGWQASQEPKPLLLGYRRRLTSGRDALHGSPRFRRDIAVYVKPLIGLELDHVVGAVPEESEMCASRSNRSDRPFLPPLTFFVLVSASPSSAQRLSVMALL